MRIYPKVKLSSLPRMADFCRWGYAVAEVLGAGGESFLRAYEQNISTGNKEAITASPVASAVVSMMGDRDVWEGSAAGLLEELEKAATSERIDTRARGWPKAANTLIKSLKQVKSNLLDDGIAYQVTRDMSNRSLVVLQKIGQRTSGTSGTSRIEAGQAFFNRRYAGDRERTSGKPPDIGAYSHKLPGDTGDAGGLFLDLSEGKRKKDALIMELKRLKMV